jgi:hypothetical protein
MSPNSSTPTKRDPSAGQQPPVDTAEHRRVAAVARARIQQQPGTARPPAPRLTGPNGGTVPAATVARRGGR